MTMQRPDDELLVAYLDGELDEAQRSEIAQWLERDAELREHAAHLTESDVLLRSAFEDVMHEEMPERLIAAARGLPAGASSDNVVAFQPRARLIRRMLGDRRWWIGIPAAAAVAGLVIGTGVGYFAHNEPQVAVATDQQSVINASAAGGSWLDNIAGYHKMFVAAGTDDVGLVDIPPNSDGDRKATQRWPADMRMPNLKPWGLDFQGARRLVVEGRPAMQLFYTTDNKALGPLTLVIGSSTRADVAPTFDHRDDLNLFYWRHQGHAYAIVGTADIGYLWNIVKDIAWQLDAI